MMKGTWFLGAVVKVNKAWTWALAKFHSQNISQHMVTPRINSPRRDASSGNSLPQLAQWSSRRIRFKHLIVRIVKTPPWHDIAIPSRSRTCFVFPLVSWFTFMFWPLCWALEFLTSPSQHYIGKFSGGEELCSVVIDSVPSVNAEGPRQMPPQHQSWRVFYALFCILMGGTMNLHLDVQSAFCRHIWLHCMKR